VFATSARSGWRDLDRVLKVQGFDEVIDANTLKAAYPEAKLGIWGVWDGFLFRYLTERLKQPAKQPLFVFVLTATNHPPYDLPADYKPVPRNRAKWGGDRSSPELWPNIDTYHYATDLLGGFVQEVESGPLRDKTVIAATGDHNGRSFGLYNEAARNYLGNQVPFIIWDKGLDCGPQLKLPAGHRDMFPTLFPLLGIHSGYVKTGRNLLLDPATQADNPLRAPITLSYYGPVRSAKGSWMLGNPASFKCTPGGPQAGPDCRFDPKLDALARAQIGLLDWNVRLTLRP
jgi:phosphoglycerol transferase MdoB-like AlkP superfamily enzyme